MSSSMTGKMYVWIITAAVFLFSAAAAGCGPNVNYIRRVQSLEEGVSSPTTIDEIKEAINKYEKRVEDIMAAENQTGIWYKILATRYIDNKMYGEALGALQKAVSYHPSNQNLFYYIGVCAGFMAKSELDFNASGVNVRRQQYLLLAESGFKRAIELEPRYVRALYGLGVLYAFDMEKPESAVPLLEKALSIETKHTDAMFVLARCYYVMYEFDKAAAVYDKIIETSSSPEKKNEARENKKAVLDAQFAQ